MTDGPFAETKEQLAGFYLFDAADLDEAVALAARIPPVRAGSIEVRPVRELDPTPESRPRRRAIRGAACRPGASLSPRRRRRRASPSGSRAWRRPLRARRPT